MIFILYIQVGEQSPTNQNNI